MKARRDFSHIERPVGVRGIKFRSKMEANRAAYWDWLLGLKRIAEWSYEPYTFWFTPDSDGARATGLGGVRRGVTSYRPDFRITELDDSHFWEETKGYMDTGSKVALARMARYYPGEKVIVVDSRQMTALRRQVGGVVPGWIP